MNSTNYSTNILILGAGVSGHQAFKKLNALLKRHRLSQKILIVDKHNYFSFAPLYHEVASGSIEPAHCTVPLRELIYKTPHQFLQSGVIRIDPKNKCVETTKGIVRYQWCVVALGSHTNYYGIPGAEEHSYHVRSLDGAMTLQESLIEILEDDAIRDIRMIIVGGGASGVEVAGQFSYFAGHDIKKLYPKKTLAISILQSQQTLLVPLPENARKKAKEKLERMGVRIVFNATVKEVQKNAVVLTSGETISSDMTIWAAGLCGFADALLPEEYVSNGRIPVNQFLHYADDPSLYALGDLSLAVNEAGVPYPQLGETAHKEGTYAARHIIASIKKQSIRPFRFESRGTLMPIGDWYGIVSIKNRWSFFGPISWWIRRTFYLLFVPGILRKLRIIADWNFHMFGFRYMLDMHKERKRK